MQQALNIRISRDREKLSWISQALTGAAPDVTACEKTVSDRLRHLELSIHQHLALKQNRIEQAAAALAALNPTSVLNRGYSIARTLPEKRVILDARMVEVQDPIEIILARGRIRTRVEKTIHGKDHI
jgi:exodeoxyribonuclease VII large subunit